MIETSPSVVRYHQGERVALFLPCYCDALFPQVGIATVKLFERLGVPLAYPMEQTCCGQPAFNAGRWKEAGSLADRFAKIFESYPWIVVPSGSCGAMARIAFADVSKSKQTVDVGSRVYDMATFLVDVMGTTDVGSTFKGRVTYHDGCHGRRELHSTRAAMTLLRSVRRLDYVELPSIEECCGFGGLFSIKYSRLSASMGRAKLDNIKASGAEVVTSGDSSCLEHLEGLLRKSQTASRLRFMHLAEILASDG
jgi:L-lactate dehydrogenase complex protein LldE